MSSQILLDNNLISNDPLYFQGILEDDFETKYFSYIDLFHIAKQGNGSRGVRVFNDERVHLQKQNRIL
jgi:hypothetical protein